LIRIDKVRFHGSEKFHNRFIIYSGTISYIVRRPKNERPLISLEKIMKCKTESDLFNIGGTHAPKGGKFSLDEYFVSRGLN
jgi:hypothetical protein